MRRNIDAALEEGRDRTLSVQRVRTLPQDERDEQTFDKTLETAGKSPPLSPPPLPRQAPLSFVRDDSTSGNIVSRISDRDQAARPLLHELRHPHHHPLEAQQRGRTRLQRLRPLLQAARREQTPGDAQGRDSDAKTETEEDARDAEREAIHRRARDRRRFNRFLPLHG